MFRRNFVSSELLLEVLNRDFDPSTLNRLYEKWEGEKDNPRLRGRQSLCDGMVWHWLRLYVDEWLATGCGGDGTESPAERTLSRTAKAKSAAAAYFEGNSF